MGALLGRAWPLRMGTLAALVAASVLTSGAARAGSFTTFESGQVRPLALSPDGSRLFAVNTPDDQLETFAVTATGLVHQSSVTVGLEPVAVAARTNDEVWVVNLLSDSISIVDVTSDPPRVTRTLLVGDEPRDIVFAGAGGTRAFITTAHRGQQRTDPSIASVPGAGDPQLTTAGVGRADVWVFDATALGTTLGGTPVGIVTLFGDTPRALAVAPDGGTVYAAVFNSGNQTTTLSEGVVCNGFGSAMPCKVDGVMMPGDLNGQGCLAQPGVGDDLEVARRIVRDEGIQRFEDRATPDEFVAHIQVEIEDEVLNGSGSGHLDCLVDVPVDSPGDGYGCRGDRVDERGCRHWLR